MKIGDRFVCMSPSIYTVQDYIYKVEVLAPKCHCYGIDSRYRDVCGSCTGKKVDMVNSHYICRFISLE